MTQELDANTTNTEMKEIPTFNQMAETLYKILLIEVNNLR